MASDLFDMLIGRRLVAGWAGLICPGFSLAKYVPNRAKGFIPKGAFHRKSESEIHRRAHNDLQDQLKAASHRRT